VISQNRGVLGCAPTFIKALGEIMSQKNKAIIRRSIDKIFNQGNLALADELYDPHYIFHEANSPDLHGPEGLKELVTIMRTAFPDMKTTIDNMIAEENQVVTHFRFTGTHQGPFYGTNLSGDQLILSPTGKQIATESVLISRFADGKIIEDWEIYDALGMRRQLGDVPVRIQLASTNPPTTNPPTTPTNTSLSKMEPTN
jgi:predicted ester cyclase